MLKRKICPAAPNYFWCFGLTLNHSKDWKKRKVAFSWEMKSVSTPAPRKWRSLRVRTPFKAALVCCQRPPPPPPPHINETNQHYTFDINCVFYRCFTKKDYLQDVEARASCLWSCHQECVPAWSKTAAALSSGGYGREGLEVPRGRKLPGSWWLSYLLQQLQSLSFHQRQQLLELSAWKEVLRRPVGGGTGAPG